MFVLTLTNVIITLLYIFPGFVLGKIKKASANHLSTLSAVLVYACSPCMVISNFLAMDYQLDVLIDMLWFLLITLLLQAGVALFLYQLLKKKYDDGKYRIFTLGAFLGNVGFFGLPIVKNLFPENPEVACFACMYVLSMNILTFTVGSFCFTRDKKYISIKAGVWNPTSISCLIGMVLLISGVGKYLPSVLLNGIDLMGKMTTTLCMIILGIRLSAVELKRLFLRPTIYVTCVVKMLAFPVLCYACVCFLPFSAAFKASILILSGTPCASIILNFAEMYESETELAANSVLVSTLLCFLTIPVLTLLL